MAKCNESEVGKIVADVVVEKLRKHSITQELLDEGAFDVAKLYIDFLKARSAKLMSLVVKKPVRLTEPKHANVPDSAKGDQ